MVRINDTVAVECYGCGARGPSRPIFGRERRDAASALVADEWNEIAQYLNDGDRGATLHVVPEDIHGQDPGTNDSDAIRFTENHAEKPDARDTQPGTAMATDHAPEEGNTASSAQGPDPSEGVDGEGPDPDSRAASADTTAPEPATEPAAPPRPPSAEPGSTKSRPPPDGGGGECGSTANPEPHEKLNQVRWRLKDWLERNGHTLNSAADARIELGASVATLRNLLHPKSTPIERTVRRVNQALDVLEGVEVEEEDTPPRLPAVGPAGWKPPKHSTPPRKEPSRGISPPAPGRYLT